MCGWICCTTCESLCISISSRHYAALYYVNMAFFSVIFLRMEHIFWSDWQRWTIYVVQFRLVQKWDRILYIYIYIGFKFGIVKWIATTAKLILAIKKYTHIAVFLYFIPTFYNTLQRDKKNKQKVIAIFFFMPIVFVFRFKYILCARSQLLKYTILVGHIWWIIKMFSKLCLDISVKCKMLPITMTL